MAMAQQQPWRSAGSVESSVKKILGGHRPPLQGVNELELRNIPLLAEEGWTRH